MESKTLSVSHDAINMPGEDELILVISELPDSHDLLMGFLSRQHEGDNKDTFTFLGIWDVESWDWLDKVAEGQGYQQGDSWLTRGDYRRGPTTNDGRWVLTASQRLERMHLQIAYCEEDGVEEEALEAVQQIDPEKFQEALKPWIMLRKLLGVDDD